ncbi:isochorismatase family protein [Govanella unica]|uniref:Isochorismatase family protein n=1 Tax=Govanella unica TaxID=2975056 RepID=A0A9X3TXW6_9PROT|nr:isochorismatase family protein [Govania unica]MDA5193688.1 isochorismatase family protein [Govania unica]
MPPQTPRYKSLLSLEECALLLIDGPFDVKDRHDAATPSAGLAILLETAYLHEVPVLVTSMVADRAHAESRFGQTTSVIVHAQANPLDNALVCETLATFARRRLLIGGGHVNTCLVFAALSALELGYDVYLLHDLCCEAASDMAVTRMLQAGAVPVSVPQVICEWQRHFAPMRSAVS